jgi:hypothetical protein
VGRIREKVERDLRDQQFVGTDQTCTERLVSIKHDQQIKVTARIDNASGEGPKGHDEMGTLADEKSL